MLYLKWAGWLNMMMCARSFYVLKVYCIVLYCIGKWSHLKRLIPGAERCIFSFFPHLWSVGRTETEQVDWSCEASDLSFGGLWLESLPGTGDSDWCSCGFLWSQANTRMEPSLMPQLILFTLHTNCYLLLSHQLMLNSVGCWHCH